jgi:hypothetical protein
VIISLIIFRPRKIPPICTSHWCKLQIVNCMFILSRYVIWFVTVVVKTPSHCKDDPFLEHFLKIIRNP